VLPEQRTGLLIVGVVQQAEGRLQRADEDVGQLCRRLVADEAGDLSFIEDRLEKAQPRRINAGV
jgi:hypothetical protein